MSAMAQPTQGTNLASVNQTSLFGPGLLGNQQTQEKK